MKAQQVDDPPILTEMGIRAENVGGKSGLWLLISFGNTDDADCRVLGPAEVSVVKIEPTVWEVTPGGNGMACVRLWDTVAGGPAPPKLAFLSPFRILVEHQ